MRATTEKCGHACSVNHADPKTDELYHFKHPRFIDFFQHTGVEHFLLVWRVLISIQFLLCSLLQTVVKCD